MADSKLKNPATLEEFMVPMTSVEWAAELKSGWPGPDGSTFSTDYIMGVCIGKTSAEFKDGVYPANRHDERYRLARRLRLSDSWRKAADIGYREDCTEYCRNQLSGFKLRFAIFRCRARYGFLRIGARFAWTQIAKVRKNKWHDENHDQEIV